MKWSLNLGNLFGIRISVHWTFLILIVWIFIMHYQMGHNFQQGLLGVFFILLIFACVTLHELGHALTAQSYGIPTRSITLLPIGGLARMERMPEKPKQELMVALAGPLVNVVIALALYAYLKTQGDLPELNTITQLTGSNMLFNLFLANLLLAGFNLIPAFPMDGGRMLRALLATNMERAKATRIAARIGQFLAIAFVFLGFFYNFWLVFIGIFIYLGAGSESAYESTKSVLRKYTVSDVLMDRYRVLQAYEPISKAVELILNSQEKEFLVTENDKITGILTFQHIIKGLSENGKEAPVRQAMKKNFLTLDPEMNLQDVFMEINRSGHTVNPVYKNGVLVGVVDLENIKELLLIEANININEK